MKNSLAENLLRFGVKNLSESNKQKLINKFLFEAAQDWITITIPSISIAYAVGATDSKPFINDIWTKINAEIDANATTKALKAANNLALQKLNIRASSSNNFNGTPTQYDISYSGNETNVQGSVDEFDLADLKTRGVTKPFTDQTMVAGYKSNLDLAKKRVTDLATNLKATMVTNGILIPDPAKGQGYEEIIKAGVMDTGGVLDDKRDTGLYKYPGQSATITIMLSGKEDIIKFPITKEELKAGLANKSVKWGNGGGDSYSEGVANPLQYWELKYLPGEGEGKNTYVNPVVRWYFTYNDKNQLTKVTQQPDPGEVGVPAAVKLAFPAKTFTINPPGKKQLATAVPLVYELLVAAGVYERFFGPTIP